MEVIIKSGNCYRPLFYNYKQISKIFFFKNGQIILETRSGWMERDKYPTDTMQITIEEPKKANKVDLSRKNNFYVSKDGNINLYIYDNNIIENLGEYVAYDEDYQTGYKTKYKVNLPCAFQEMTGVDEITDRGIYELKNYDSFVTCESMRWEDKPNRIEFERIQEKLKKIFLHDHITLSSITDFLTQFKEV